LNISSKIKFENSITHVTTNHLTRLKKKKLKKKKKKPQNLCVDTERETLIKGNEYTKKRLIRLVWPILVHKIEPGDFLEKNKNKKYFF